MVDAYEGIMGNQDVDHLRHILPLVSIMLTISPTTAQCERGFSQMNQVNTVKDIIESGNDIFSFKNKDRWADFGKL